MNTHAVSDDEFSSDDDALLAELEKDDDDFLAEHRERRMEELKREMTKVQSLKQNAHGSYETIRTEKDVLQITTTTPLCVVHFGHKDFRRCQLMDKHLAELARKHFETRFIRIDVENAPFLVERMKIKVLPCIIPFIDGVAVDRLIGFEGIGENDNVPTSAVEAWLQNSKVLTPPESSIKTRKTIFGFPENRDKDGDSEDDDDY